MAALRGSGACDSVIFSVYYTGNASFVKKQFFELCDLDSGCISDISGRAFKLCFQCKKMRFCYIFMLGTLAFRFLSFGERRSARRKEVGAAKGGRCGERRSVRGKEVKEVTSVTHTFSDLLSKCQKSENQGVL